MSSDLSEAVAPPVRAMEPPPPPDQESRRIIETELETTMLVEAAAGTGKTTSMMRRMVALLAEGRCTTDTMSAVTFTRKAAAELRSRFTVALEKAAAGAEAGAGRARLQDGLAHVERCFIGTIHSFCARLLRQRPVEAGVDVAFEELDEQADGRLRRRAWDEHLARLHAGRDPVLAEIYGLGLRAADLREAYLSLADYPDVQEWPARPLPLDPGRLHGVRAALLERANHARALHRALWQVPNRDRLMRLYLDLPHMVESTRLDRARELVDLLEECAAVEGSSDIKVRSWPAGQTQGRAERDSWLAFLDGHARPLVEARRRQRYEPCLRFLRGAVETYRVLRAERGCLNFQDLLMLAARLLREHAHVRAWFRQRLTHLLVDEFQDTDPVQAEVMLLLTAADPEERDWRRCVPVPGSLFVVGDPKQSIYRFRRADIVTYNEVREIIEAAGRVVPLSSNFRSIRPIIAWANTVSGELFKDGPNEYGPRDTPMDPARPGRHEGHLTGVARLDVPAACTNKEAIRAHEAEFIARTIRDAIDRGLTVPRTPEELAAGRSPAAEPGDFMIVTRTRDPLVAYAQALERLGIPVEVTGGTAVNRIDEVSLLHAALRSIVEPHEGVALVGALRSPLFGISDTELYRYQRDGGRFDLALAGRPGPRGGHERIADAIDRLRAAASWLRLLPPVAAIERIAADLGLWARAAAGRGGPAAGGLGKAIELLRAVHREDGSLRALVRYLDGLLEPEPLEKHDALPARPHARRAVQVMNLHQVKGLEAPVVFLAEGGPRRTFDPDLHVDRRAAAVRGYLVIRGRRGRHGNAPVLAEPEGWEEHRREENHFEGAEENRLLYVAATRAGARIVVCRAAGGKRGGRPAWEELAGLIPAESAAAEPPEVVPPAAAGASLEAGAPREAEARIRERWRAAGAVTFDVQAVKRLSVRGAVRGGRRHGTELGSVVHELLEAAMNDAGTDPGPRAESALHRHALDRALVAGVLQDVRRVMESDLWRRARASPRRLTEVPIQFMVEAGSAVPTMARGVIDLVFLEDGAWVLVDYKTDDPAGRSLDQLAAHYAPQVKRYAEAWEHLTGVPVRETALFFVRAGVHQVVDRSPGPGA